MLKIGYRLLKIKYYILLLEKQRYMGSILKEDEMRVALLTFTKCLNYGASLQAYALQYAIKKYGGEKVFCEYLDYHRNYCKDAAIWLSRKLFYRVIGKDDSPSWTVKEFFENVYSYRGGGNVSVCKGI